MSLQNDLYEVKKSMDKIVESHARQIQVTGGTGQLTAGISRGHVILIDATGREHSMFLEQCQHLDVCSHNTDIYIHESSHMILATGSHGPCQSLSVQARPSRDPKVVH